MFQRFTDRARRVVVLAQEEARAMGHNYIGTEHVLAGLLAENEGVAAQALTTMNVPLVDVRKQLDAIVGKGPGQISNGHIPFTPRAKKVMELSLRESLQLGHNYIGTEHVLLGLIREGENPGSAGPGVAATILGNLGVDLVTARNTVIGILESYRPRIVEEPTEEPETRMSWDRETMAKSPECPVCGALVIERNDHRIWHDWLWSVVDDRLARYDRIALNEWALYDPKARKAV